MPVLSHVHHRFNVAGYPPKVGQSVVDHVL
jgi:hypothetical protein